MKKIIYITLTIVGSIFLGIVSYMKDTIKVDENPLFYLDNGRVLLCWTEDWQHKRNPAVKHWFIEYKSNITGDEEVKMVTQATFNSSSSHSIVYFYNEKNIYKWGENISFLCILVGVFGLISSFMFFELRGTKM